MRSVPGGIIIPPLVAQVVSKNSVHAEVIRFLRGIMVAFMCRSDVEKAQRESIHKVTRPLNTSIYPEMQYCQGLQADKTSSR